MALIDRRNNNVENPFPPFVEQNVDARVFGEHE